MIGRETELAWLDGWAARADRGAASRALVRGEAGIGKTALLDTALAERRDTVVVRLEADPDPAPLEVAELLGEALGRGRGDGDLAAAILERLGALQESGTVVVVLHDLHDADEASAHLLTRVLRRLRHDRVLVVASARPGTLSPLWERYFAPGPDAGTLTLGGLDAAGVRDLVAALRPGTWSRAVVTRLHEATRGHPLHLLTLLRELPDEVLLGDEPLPAPRSLAEEVAGTTARLGAPAERLLACLAVIDRAVGSALLGRLEELQDVSIDDAAAELAGAGLVDPSGLGARRTLRLHHPLVRSAVYTALSTDRRRRLHLDVARVVGGSAALAHWVAAAGGDPDDRLAAELEAAARADAVDLAAAARHLLDAARLSSSGTDADRRLLAACLLLVDTYDSDRLRALEPEVRAARACPERDVVLGFLASQTLDPLAVEYLQHAHESPTAPDEVRALAAVRLALEHIFRGRGRAADEVAATVPGRTRRPARREQAVILQAVGRAQACGPDAGLALLDEPLAGAVGADPAITAATLHLAAGRIAEADRYLDEAMARIRRGEISTSTHRAHCHRVEVLYRTGRWDLAEAEADVALDWFADGDRPWALSLAHAVAALVPAARGERDRARHHLDAARASLARTSNPQGAHALALAEATAARADGDPRALERALRPLPGIAARGGMASAPFAPWRVLHAESLVGVGDVPGARRLLRAWPRTEAPLWFRLARHQLQARIELAVGDTAGAESALRAGIALADKEPEDVARECPLELAELRALLGTLDHVPDRAEQVAAAREVFEALAVTPWLDRLTTVARSERADPDEQSLTPRERQVAGLVAQGMTSREAAEVLWITRKAVDYHLGNVYAKLRLTSRRQLRGRTFA